MVSVTKADKDTLRRLRLSTIAMVFQQFGLLPWRTVRDNVGLGLELAGQTARSAPRQGGRTAGPGEPVSQWADRKVGELSGGMQQRVGLARAFVTDAPILLMDEPFSALDPLIRARLQDELLDLQAKLKRTIIFVSHDLDEAFKLGNRIALMEGGRIVQIGTAREIIANPISDYVADFVAHMNPLGVLTARDVMEPGTSTATASVDAELPVKEVMALLSQGATELTVTDRRRPHRHGPRRLPDGPPDQPEARLETASRFSSPDRPKPIGDAPACPRAGASRANPSAGASPLHPCTKPARPLPSP